MKVKQKIVLEYLRARLNILALISKEKAAKKAFELFSTPHNRQRKDNPPVYSKAEKLSFEMDGLTIKGFRWNAEAARKVMIIHGFESNSRNFEKYISALIRQHYQVLAFDAPAHGKSDGKSIILPQYVQMLQYAHTLFGPVQGYIAHSFGGLALTHYLEQVPHSSAVRAVLIAPATETTTAVDVFFNLLQLKTDIRKEFDELILKKGGVPASHYSIRRAMKSIQASVLWFHDHEDRITPLKDALMVKEDAAPNIEFVITEGLGHSRIYREPAVLTRTIEFLTAPPRGAVKTVPNRNPEKA